MSLQRARRLLEMMMLSIIKTILLFATAVALLEACLAFQEILTVDHIRWSSWHMLVQSTYHVVCSIPGLVFILGISTAFGLVLVLLRGMLRIPQQASHTEEVVKLVVPPRPPSDLARPSTIGG